MPKCLPVPLSRPGRIFFPCRSEIMMHKPLAASRRLTVEGELLPARMRRHQLKSQSPCRNRTVPILVRSALICPNTHSWSGPHDQVLLLLSSSRSGWVCSAREGENFPSWFAMPRNLSSSETLLGDCIAEIAEIFSELALMPFALITWPRNFTCVL